MAVPNGGLAFPNVHMSRVIGLMEILNDNLGSIELSKVSKDYLLDLDELLPVVDSAELLGFVKADQGILKLTSEGALFISMNPRNKKAYLQKKMMALELFRKAVEIVNSAGGCIPRRAFLVELAKRYPLASSELVDWIIYYGRLSLLLRYDSQLEMIWVMSKQ